MGNRKHTSEPPKQDTKEVKQAQQALQERIVDNRMDELDEFSKLDDDDMEEGTAAYYKFEKAGDKIDALFMGTETRNLDKKNPEKVTECAMLKLKDGSKIIMAQTVAVRELKKRWEKEQEIGFPCRIIYMGKKGEGSDQYETFRILFKD